MNETSAPNPAPHKRRVRYSGTHPRRFSDKYKEHNPERYADTVQKVLESGKTPAGTHRPIMVGEILEVLSPKPGDVAADCTLGYGGHAREILS
ncbi:MAG TPA: 16S rRNA (cytosine(1402)-N(4))-methyltransferase, partial [Verrucomicrobiota bacterium]|nr:16S rRNA (cytosine(1402)-N(4))-methyltransferase [Verrucomicrobiota bacterium]